MATQELFSILDARMRESPVKASLTTALVLIGTVLVVTLYRYYTSEPDLSHIPLLGAELSHAERKEQFAKDAKTFLARGYEEFNKHGKAFRLDTAMGPRVIVGIDGLEDVRSKPDSVVSNLEPVYDAVQNHYTQIGAPDDTVLHVIKADLATKVGQLTESLAEEVDEAFDKFFPPCEDWTPVKIYENLLLVVAIISTRLFLGKELTTDMEWIQNTIEYTVTLMNAAHDIQRTHWLLRPYKYRTFDSFKKHKAAHALTLQKVKPILVSRREALKLPDHEQYFDMTQWMLNERINRGHRDDDYNYLAQAQLQLSFASIHTTSMALLHTLFDLCAEPKYQTVIREELNEQLAANGGYKGEIMKKLEKTDSIMKESQRHNPVGLSAVERYVLEPFNLSNGTYIPKGTIVRANAYAITHDPDVLQSGTDPNTFDGLRYYNMRKKLMKTSADSREVAGKHQFVSVSQNSLMFGYGRHACPGRFFAANELKVILVKVLERFEIKYPEGVTKRYPNGSFEQSLFPHTDGIVMMKRIPRKKA